MQCPCHAFANLVANAACNAIPEACEELLRKWRRLSLAVSSSCILDQFQKSFSFDGTCRKFLKLCERRWFSNHASVSRLKIEMNC